MSLVNREMEVNMMFLFLIPLLVIAFFVFKYYQDGELDFTKGRETPMEILNRRFAEGEVDEEEYRKIKKTLTE